MTRPNMNCINCKFLCVSTKLARRVLFLIHALMLQICIQLSTYLFISIVAQFVTVVSSLVQAMSDFDFISGVQASEWLPDWRSGVVASRLPKI